MRNFKIIITYRSKVNPPKEDFHATVMVLEPKTGYPTLVDALGFLQTMARMSELTILTISMVNLEDGAPFV